jgi:hypothetical protein
VTEARERLEPLELPGHERLEQGSVVEQNLRVRLPANALVGIRSFKDLEKAVRAHLPAR